ncbi:TetR family transcriptional regulator [Saccharothrix saharensis]|uniref:TetR family transcriptional regulator n=1 Tax=Saccharothrix saharensis TaxID=571190 RepID=A0A543JET8_9PSEU|nr:TetR/AcrR family transcriptional regulator [Saccharothrix saharensis]TQM81340.1 TetR family transcriptional regulator [Saccharothrix saharensis]
MRAKSVTEQARRAQVIAAAIEVLAELGYGATSFRRIAARAGLSSTGLISYHFKGKQELVDSVYAEVRRTFAEFVLERMDRADTAAGELRAFLSANLRFLAAHRAHMVALAQVRPHVSAADSADDDHRKMADLLREGQRRGEFRGFDADTMAIFVLALRNGVLARAADHAEVDLDLCERELLTTVELATTRG